METSTIHQADGGREECKSVFIRGIVWFCVREVGVRLVLKVEEVRTGGGGGGLLVVLNKEVIPYQPYNASVVNYNNRINTHKLLTAQSTRNCLK